jgi:Uma2 family endonuclease
MSSTLQEHRPTTLSDVLSRLGDIPLDRIRWDPRPGTATGADAIRAECCELIDGVLVEKAMGYPESRIGQVLAVYFELWAAHSHVGFVIGDGAMTRMQTGNMRIPDVYMVRWERVPGRVVPHDAISTVAPHLAIEVFSPGNTEKEIERKRGEFFASGTEQVWVVRPETETIDVWTSPKSMLTLGVDDMLDGGTVAPGFRLPVREVFEAGRRGEIDVKLALAMLRGETSDE